MAKSNGRVESKSVRYYLPCQVEPGMFAEEFLAVFEGADPTTENQMIKIQLLVDAEVVNLHGRTPSRGRPTNGQLIVELVRRMKDWAVVALPQPAFPVGTTAIVHSKNLAPVL